MGVCQHMETLVLAIGRKRPWSALGEPFLFHSELADVVNTPLRVSLLRGCGKAGSYICTVEVQNFHQYHQDAVVP